MLGNGSSGFHRVAFILRIFFTALFALMAAGSGGHAHAAGGRGENSEASSEESSIQGAQESEPGQISERLFSAHVYDLVREGSEEDLRAACEERGLSTDGDLVTLRKRLLQYEMETQLGPFEEKREVTAVDALILNHADFIRYTEAVNGDELVLLSGNVDILYGGRRITADSVTINSSRKLVSGNGNVQILIGDDLYLGESFFLNDASDEGYFYESKTRLGEFIYTGSVIHKIQGEEKYSASDVTLSTEDIKHPHYWIEAEELNYYDEERVLIKNASIYYGQDDLLRLPYMYRNLREKNFRTALYFRERSGIVWQNTYVPYKTDEREFVLKGDLYERLGIYTGLEYDVGDRTAIDLSVAFSKDVYEYDDVTENWSNLTLNGGSEYGINRSVRYKEGLYKKFEFGTGYTNTTELNLIVISDPYYEYDYERRSVGFDFFQFINQAERDNPTKGSGYSWYLNNFFVTGNFDWYVKNTLRFEAQRNDSEDTVSLNDYYEYQPYSITAPQSGVSYSDTLFEESVSPIVRDLDLSAYADYAHIRYYEPDADLWRRFEEDATSRLHKISGEVAVKKPYQIGNFFRFTPHLIAGGRGQLHMDRTKDQEQQDEESTMLYGQIIDEWRFGPDAAYIDLKHNLRYKLAGPDDRYTYNRFRIHELTMTGYAKLWHFSDELSTVYDLRPTYDWDTGSYDPFVWDTSHFQPLRNTFLFAPSELFELRDILVYSIAESRFKTNQFSLGITSPDWYLRSHHFLLSWDLSWHHNFVNPVVDELRSIFRIDADIHRYWKFYIYSLSLNEDIWRYLPGETADPINPIVDLLKSFNFFNTDDRKASYFKLKTVSFGFVRDLHEWELIFDYTGDRVLKPSGATYYWEQTFSISLGLKKVEGVRVHTTVESQ